MEEVEATKDLVFLHEHARLRVAMQGKSHRRTFDAAGLF